ncbi:MAG: GWxTD domain-containing protein [Ignavibacteriae bacterium]|nr:GWxTD domain-containing protein [Ignavibacteriota bacterium]
MKNRLFIFLATFLMMVAIQTEAKKIPFTVDAAQFRYDDTHSLCEFYYSFPDTALRYIKNGNKYIGSLRINLQINSSTLGVVDKKKWISDNISDTAIRTHRRNLIGQKSFILSPGQYTVEIEIYDINDSTTNAKTTLQLIVRTVPKNSIALSDIELASRIYPQNSSSADEVNSVFAKNNFIVVPNPKHEFIGTEPSLSIYSEIYNAKTFAHDSIRVEYKILDGAKREQFTVQLLRPALSDAIVESTSIPLDGLSSGLYYLQLMVQSVSNPTDNITAIKKFYVLNPEMPVELAPSLSEDELFHSSEFATLSAKRVEDEYSKAKILATHAEVQLYESINDNIAKQKFLYRFWKERDPKPETPQNERLDDFRKAIAHANTFFSNILIKEGWKTDQGRVLMKYGFPSQVDRHTNESGVRPYEIWYIDGKQGGIQFQFVDLKGFGNYIQINSTAIGEPRNDRWFEQYVQMFDSGSNQLDPP